MTLTEDRDQQHSFSAYRLADYTAVFIFAAWYTMEPDLIGGSRLLDRQRSTDTR